MRRIARPLVLGLALGVAVIATACSKKEEATAKPVAAFAVSVARVQAQDIPRSVLVSGPVSAWEEMQLGVEVSGLRVTSLLVDVGQAVRKGELLLQLDHRSLDAELAQADAALREAEAGASLARSQLARGELLVKDKYISATQLDELRAGRVKGDARVGTARAMRDTAALRRSFADLRAPDAGVISKRLVQPGQVVASGSELLRLIRQGRLEWRAELAEAELGRVKPGDRIQLTTRDGKAVVGQVRAVSPGVDASTRTGTVYADLPDPQGLQPGTYLQGRIDTGIGQGLTVPAATVVQRDGHPNVFTVDAKGIAHRVRIRTGGIANGQVEVLEGLKAGDAVVEQGAGFLGDGDSVRIVEATPATTP
ncbi:efflux RND transporter periplasmic adaptor subunit [Thermomonas carbonis]|uniref:Efflux RND transporter periplasmic adaptor subunit n=1 Tax=Thermomonas carbonis TaxID=1463158 RepID=A0A7G9SSY5_9GAMM|nr:efflux RND transporter periplasmic adaptor subunit [Thermomonas carbonis]QNN70960.1 efflux RND transporter periplasmic adaptor subunit [Thermomonas carbonis]GHC03642.1 MexH family multidrug efflux RND transporter periplasmic adaptor subunit [Thermomonas carbonis]